MTLSSARLVAVGINATGHTPNRTPASTRLLRIAGAVALLFYGVAGEMIDYLSPSPEHGFMRLQGLPAWTMLAATSCAILVLIFVAFDCHGTRENGKDRQNLNKRLSLAGWTLAGTSLGLYAVGMGQAASAETGPWQIADGFILFALALAIGLTNERVIEYGKQVPDLQPRGEGSQWMLASLAWLTLVSGIVVLLIGISAALFGGTFAGYLKTTAGIALLTISRLLFIAQNSSGKAWRTLRIGILLTVGLWAYWYVIYHHRGNWLPEDEIERQTAPPFDKSLQEFRGGMTVSDIKASLSSMHFRIRCFTNLGPRERLESSDSEVCWTIPKHAWGIPSHQLTFFFGAEGLRRIMVEFAPEHWPRVKTWFVGLPGVDAGSFGTDAGGNLIRGRMLDNGLLITAEPKRMPAITVLWTSRQRLLDDQCTGRKLQVAQKQLLCKPNP